ncbi:MAG: hypothetical protein F6K26_29420 [Moorea sp. SIO2I5]|nr:hypothetical protein [Moorena sp. SIO2I5]
MRSATANLQLSNLQLSNLQLDNLPTFNLPTCQPFLISHDFYQLPNDGGKNGKEQTLLRINKWDARGDKCEGF